MAWRPGMKAECIVPCYDGIWYEFPDGTGRKVRGPVALPPGPEDHVMGAFDGVDAVDLHEAEPVDQRQKVVALCRAGWGLDQRVPLEEEPPRRRVRQVWRVHRPQVRSKSASQF